MRKEIPLPFCSFLTMVVIAIAATTFTHPELKAQSLQIIDAPSQPIQGHYDDGNDLSTEFNVKNTSSSELQVGAFRKVVDDVPGSENRYCWSPTCWPPTVDTANAVQSISANGGVDSTFIGYYTPNNNPGMAAIKYCFYDTSNVGDSACTIVRYDATSSVSIEEHAGNGIRLGLSPNPANERLTVSFDSPMSGTVRLHSILGETVLERRIDKGQKEFELDVSEMEEGLHFITFRAKGNASVTEKVMIRN